MIPKKIKVEDNRLKIFWDNDSETSIKLANLRDYCPCAFCKTERGKRSENFIPFFTDDQTTIDKIIPVGNYAVNIIWKDGHQTGFYDYEYLTKFNDE